MHKLLAGLLSTHELLGSNTALDVALRLAMHLRALAWLERPASARALVRSISERFDQRGQRQRFRKQWQGRVRI